MGYELIPRTEPGAKLAASIASISEALQARSTQADQANTITVDNFHDIKRAGITGAFVPSTLGGIGLTSMHDWIATIGALARADGSTALAMNMHFSVTRGLAAAYASEKSTDAARERAERMLRAIVSGDMLVCSTTTERGTDNLHPLAEAVRTENGWTVNGQKFFVTMSPIATHISLNVRTRAGAANPTADDSIANLLLPMNTPGIEPQDDWDALGMRGSGSQSIVLNNCQAPLDALRIIGPWGQWSPQVLLHRTLANIPLVGAFLGIAERAYQLTLDHVSGKSSGAREISKAGLRHTIAEMEIKLAMAQSLLAQAGQRLDEFLKHHALPSEAEGHEIMKDYQSAKWVVNQNAIEIVSSAMDIAGGGGFMARHPLTQLYRDVRAGPFMQPHSRVDAREYIGQVVLKDFPES